MSIQFRLTKEIVAELDKLAPSPNEKALKVSEYLAEGEKFSLDEINAFCIAHLGGQAHQQFSGVKDHIVAINRHYYLLHYYTVSEERGKYPNGHSPSEMDNTTNTEVQAPSKSGLLGPDGNPL